MVISFAPPAQADRFALVVGNADYRHERLLRTPRNDAKSVAAALEDLGFDVTFALDLDELAFGDALADYQSRARNASVSLFYYSGHGLEIDGTNYIIPTDAKLEREIDAKLHAIELGDAIKAISSGSKLSISIIDACRNNGFGDGKGTSFGAMTRTVALPGQIIGYSTAPGALAFESDGDLSPYTRALLERINANPHEDVRIMLSSLTEKTRSYAKREQVPYVEIGAFPEGKVSLARPAAQETDVQIAATTLALNPITDWSVVGSSYDLDGDRLIVDVPEVAQEIWQSALYKRQVHLVKGARYNLRMKGRADQSRDINIWLGHQPDGPSGKWEQIASHGVTLQPNWSDTNFSFDAPLTTEEAQLTLQYGLSDVNLEFAQITFEKVSEPAAALSTFKDCDLCPEMLVIPGGSYLRGAHPENASRGKAERPQSEVSIAPFALATHEVTVAEFRRFAQDVGFEAKSCWVGRRDAWTLQKDVSWDRPAFERTDDHPVTCVSFEDARRYTDWLNTQIGRDLYRIPSEAEWEYAARAETTTPYFTGEEISESVAHFFPKGAKSLSDPTVVSTVSVFEKDAANPWGLRHVLGNAYEWTADCFLDDHTKSRKDGIAATAEDGGDCDRRPLRGGSMISATWGIAVSNRYGEEQRDRLYHVGFRVARDLD